MTPPSSSKSKRDRTERLAAEQVEAKLGAFPEWTLTGDSIQRTFGFEDFMSALAFVNRIAELAERHKHHPDIMIRYNKVTLTLSTHDAGGVTERDFTFAREADQLLATAH